MTDEELKRLEWRVTETGYRPSVEETVALCVQAGEAARLVKQREILLEVLWDVTLQACWQDDGHWDSSGISVNANAMRMLAEHGKLKLDGEEKGRWITATEVKP